FGHRFAGHDARSELLERGEVDVRGFDDDFEREVECGHVYCRAKMATASCAAEMSGMGMMPKTSTPSAATPSERPMVGVVGSSSRPSASTGNNWRATTR